MKFLEITYFKGLHCKKWHFTPHSTSKAPAGLTLSPAYHTKKKRRFIVLNRAMTFHQWLRQISMKLHWKLDLADTDLAENLGLKDTLQEIWATFFNF